MPEATQRFIFQVVINSTFAADTFFILRYIINFATGRKEMFYLTTHLFTVIWRQTYGKRTTQIVREETRCRHIGYSFRLAARVLIYASSHRQVNTSHCLCYTSRGALGGTRNSSMGPPHEGSIRRPIAPWANALTMELHLASFATVYGKMHNFATAYDKMHNFATVYGKMHKFATVYDKMHNFATAYDKMHNFATAYGKMHNFATAYDKMHNFATACGKMHNFAIA